MNINVTTTKTITIPSDYTFQFLDNASSKTVRVFINGTPYNFILWSGAAYDAAGQYTQSDITTAVSSSIAALVTS